MIKTGRNHLYVSQIMFNTKRFFLMRFHLLEDWNLDRQAPRKYNSYMVNNKYSMVRSFLQRKLKKKVRLTTTKNRDILISFENHNNLLDVKINTLFLKAPFSVLDLLVDFIKTNNQAAEKKLKKYINEYSPRKTKKKTTESVEKISHLGKVYNLKVLFDMINEKYFDNKTGKVQIIL